MRFSIQTAVSLIGVASATISAPVDTSSGNIDVNRRDDWDEWPRCLILPEGECTLYMATGKEEYAVSADSRYRNFALFDNNCQLVSFQESLATNPWIMMQGHLEEAIAISLSDDLEPEGYLYSDGKEYKIQEEIECRDWEDLDGVGCRMGFSCSDAF